MPSLSDCPIEGCRCREPKGVGASLVKSKCFIAPIGSRKVIHFYSPMESSLSIVGSLGLSGSLFLGLLVLDFYHPTNRDLYWWVRGGVKYYIHTPNPGLFLVGGGGVFLWEILIFFKVV